MRLVLAALRRPITALVLVLVLASASLLAIRRMKADIFPNLGAPAIYVAQPYSGMDPAQMEGYLTYYFEYHFLYITGIEHVESKSIQGAALMKLVFHDDADMSQAMAQVVGYVNRARSFMPPGTVPPFIVRYDAGSVPVGQLVFTGPTHSPAEMQDFALNRVRPLFATLEGVSAPPPFGGNQKTIVVRLNPERLASYHMSPEEAIAAVNKASLVMPSGVLREGDLTRIASNNSVLTGNMDDLANAPVRVGSGPAVYIRDIGTVENSTDILVGYAHVNGHRTVYIPVTKRADASTLDVIARIKAALPAMRAVVPDDVKIELEFDQSRFVTGAIRSLLSESALGALLTALMVLLFLRDWRSALIVIVTIPFALLGSIVLLWATGQTLNIMTLGGLALAVGVLVDEATVEIENIHSHMDAGLGRMRAVVEACKKTALPRLLSMLCVLSVFVPSFYMTGVGRQMFVPLALAAGFALFSSWVLSSTLVPVLSGWLMRPNAGHARKPGLYGKLAVRIVDSRWMIFGAYAVGMVFLLAAVVPRLRVELFPAADATDFQIRLRAATGTRIERTEPLALKALDLIQREAGRAADGSSNVAITTDYVGVQPASYPVNTIYLFTSGPQEAVLQIALKPEAPLRGEAFRERMRKVFAAELPEMKATFEAGDIISRVLSFGSPTPIEVAVQGAAMDANRKFAASLRTELAKIDDLRDLAYGQPQDYPSVQIDIDRKRAGQLGLTMADVARSIVPATSSSRFIEPNFWRDPGSGNAFQIQVEIPQNKMQSLRDLADLPVTARSGSPDTVLADVASLKYGNVSGEVDRYNMQRVVSLTANLHGQALGEVLPAIDAAIKRVGAPPKGVAVEVRGQAPALKETTAGLQTGLALSIAVIFALLLANFQSLRLTLVVLTGLPAVVAGAGLMLLATGTTLNVQSFLGAIMALGVSVANSILLVSFCEQSRVTGSGPLDAAMEGATGRSRAILMTACAMIVGMVPMAMGFGEAAQQTAPLGRAVIGGLAASTFATLFILPAAYAVLQTRSKQFSPSLDPDDPTSQHYDA
jgi:multidrug efflux pump subunit AcrB